MYICVTPSTCICKTYTYVHMYVWVCLNAITPSNRLEKASLDCTRVYAYSVYEMCACAFAGMHSMHVSRTCACAKEAFSSDIRDAQVWHQHAEFGAKMQRFLGNPHEWNLHSIERCMLKSTHECSCSSSPLLFHAAGKHTVVSSSFSPS